MRVKLTKTKAEQIRVARAQLGLSQFKRLEKGEVQSIEADDRRKERFI
jgi:hypothetical protein